MVMSHMAIAKAVADVNACTEEIPGRFVLAANPDIICFQVQLVESVSHFC